LRFPKLLFSLSVPLRSKVTKETGHYATAQRSFVGPRRQDGAKWTDRTGEDSAPVQLRWRQVFVSIRFPGEVDRLDRSDRDCRAAVPRLRPDGAKWTVRIGEDSAPVLFSVVPSLCFHIVFLGKWTDRTDRTDRTGITSGCCPDHTIVLFFA
jgi:hypothetical protein